MNWKSEKGRSLIAAFRSARTDAEMQRFLRDLLTAGEITEFAKRFQAARMLDQKIPYVAIERATGLSSTTIARVSKWLNSSGGGYRTAISRLHHLPHPIARGLN